ncbi:HD domain-containing protein [Microbulbifer sp. THAF38]|uniref:HD domain-containing protein n=1 Tax=Microbulbifer sp. THAF38 TaxID=2587856 RepID=UPI001267F1F9|nr:HD domain-containing protein [Microbulbifer sp. THAF38]QFT54132.1 5'-nucleotidase [Microbulbifer sp. THAF38]
MKDIEKALRFIVEIEKLKNVQRKTKPVGLKRFENSAEHSWHACLCALILKDYSNDPINIDRVIKMLLIHDLGEIDAGDTIIYSSETNAAKAKEKEGLQRLVSPLPGDMNKELVSLWEEFESGETADARFAKAIDRIPPLLHNIYGGGHSWKQYGITKEQVFSLNARIGKGSEELWSEIRSKLEGAVKDGILK